MNANEMAFFSPGEQPTSSLLLSTIFPAPLAQRELSTRPPLVFASGPRTTECFGSAGMQKTKEMPKPRPKRKQYTLSQLFGLSGNDSWEEKIGVYQFDIV